MIRVNLYWGGTLGVAKAARRRGRDPARCRLRLVALRPRRAVTRREYGIKVAVLDLRDAALGERRRRLERRAEERRPTCAISRTPPRRATAAPTPTAGGRCSRRCGSGSPGTSRTTRSSSSRSTSASRRKWVIQSAIDYAKICNAVYAGVHATLLTGREGRLRRHRARAATTTRAAHARRSRRSRSCARRKKAGLKRFDAWAHHPYYGVAARDPDDAPRHANGRADRGHARRTSTS